MPYREYLEEPVLERWMMRFGSAVKSSRRAAGMSQEKLEHHSGVDQTAISRLERGRAPYMSLMRLARLSVGLQGGIPIGSCPHAHTCPWSPPMVAPDELLTYTRHRQLIAAGFTERAQLEMLDRIALPHQDAAR